LKTKDFLIIIF